MTSRRRKRLPDRALDELRAQYLLKRNDIRNRLDEFERVPESEYFYELIYCLLTPQSSAEHAGKVVEALRRDRFRERGFDPEPYLRNRSHYVRFHRVKSKRLRAARKRSLDTSFLRSDDIAAFRKREFLVREFTGLGFKEATHFLRNIGRSENLAILDRHILHSLETIAVIDVTPPTLPKKRYLEIEAVFQEFAERIEIPMTHLDLLFWSMQTGQILK
ncbi:MAG: DNA lyase [Ignavibacteria bacterium]|nr:DNA lyase [Ignavibacteria bacterium]